MKIPVLLEIFVLLSGVVSFLTNIFSKSLELHLEENVFTCRSISISIYIYYILYILCIYVYIYICNTYLYIRDKIILRFCFKNVCCDI